MKEDFLHYVWKYGLFSASGLATTSGKKLLVKSFGQHNTESGPDFFNARVVIGETEWAGNVEIHLKSSDWLAHGHTGDKAYDNVVLHVVFEDDVPVSVKGVNIPTLELKSRISLSLLKRYQQLQIATEWVPCEAHLKEVSSLEWGMVKDRLLVERLERKASDLALIYIHTNKDWFETLYRFSAKYFGQPQNGLCFQAVTQQLPYSLLARYSDDLPSLEALLFGVADLLPGPQDPYTAKLQGDYDFLARKHGLKRINMPWKFGRMRPAALPTMRMALFAAFVVKLRDIHSRLIDAPLNFEGWFKQYEFETSEYWKTHYVFLKETPAKAKSMGPMLKNTLLINAFVPYLFHYGKSTGNLYLSDKAIEMLSNATAEGNKIIRQWRRVGAQCVNAAETQAMLELKNSYCDHKKCVLCSIGNSILKKSI